uniref:PAX-interacting protein 1 n=1 Tax=Parascaris univalens TaxID=6257 RepID=A0A915AE80_PARUN
SAPCTPDNGPHGVVRDSEMCDSRGAMTPVSVGVSTSSFMSEAPSPLGQLDPHRLRDMVVDKQNPSCQPQIESPYKQQQQQQYWTPSPVGGPTPSPSNMRSTPANSNSPLTPMMHPSRISQGSGTPHSMREPQILSPGSMRMQIQQQQMGLCLPGRSPLGSPGNMHPPPSPYITRPPSNASPSAYMQPPQTPVHYPGGMQQLSQQASASGVLPPGQVPPASPSGVYAPRMSAMGPPQQQYAYHPQVQPQWNAQPPQTHYVGQPQMMGPSGPPQRVMVQRVPYPASGYPQGMSQPQSSSGQPPPSAVVYPQGGMPPQGQPQRALYPQGPAPQTGQSAPAQYPPAYYQQKGQPGYPQPPMYRQQGAPQSVPVRAYLGNQPTQIASSPAYSMYPTASGAPQSAVQPQQYSPVATRYPTPVQNASGISPCYPPSAHDMRSPQLMSPTQAPVVPTGVPQAAPPTMIAPVPASAPPMQRSMSSMELQGNGTAIAPQHMRMVPQSAPFYGHEPNIANSVSPEMCLMGCFFVVVEHERVLVDRLDVQEISAVVRLHGGEIEFGPRAYNSANADRITHVICESLRHQLVQQALKERKRCVTLQWLNDVLAKKHLEAPFRVAHLPTYWADNHRPASGKIIAINGFNQSERSGIRMMITAIGARFTPYLTKHNHFLVTKTVEGEKVERSRELGVTVVNYQWLVELYLGIKSAVHDNESGYYPMPGMFPDVNVSPYTLELYSEVCKQLLAAWRTPVIFSTEQWQRAAEVKRNVESDENIFPNKKLRLVLALWMIE